jgi:hypothetical protein
MRAKILNRQQIESRGRSIGAHMKLKRVMRALLATILLVVAPDLAAAAPELEATLAAEIDKGGKPRADLTLTNHSERNVCFYDDFAADVEKSDGSLLGSPMVIDYVWPPDSMNIVWTGGDPQHYQIDFDPDWLVLTPNETAQAAKVTVDFKVYDCTELLASHGAKPKMPLYKMNLTTVPTKNWPSGLP